jgi:hypothetical protein
MHSSRPCYGFLSVSSFSPPPGPLPSLRPPAASPEAGGHCTLSRLQSVRPDPVFQTLLGCLNPRSLSLNAAPLSFLGSLFHPEIPSLRWAQLWSLGLRCLALTSPCTGYPPALPSAAPAEPRPAAAPRGQLPAPGRGGGAVFLRVVGEPPPTHCFRGHSRPRHPALARLALLDSVTAAGTSPDPAASLAGCAPACAWSSAWGNRWSGTAGNAGGLPRPRPRPEGYQWILASWLKTLASVVGCRDCHVRSISNTN